MPGMSCACTGQAFVGMRATRRNMAAARSIHSEDTPEQAATWGPAALGLHLSPQAPAGVLSKSQSQSTQAPQPAASLRTGHSADKLQNHVIAQRPANVISRASHRLPTARLQPSPVLPQKTESQSSSRTTAPRITLTTLRTDRMQSRSARLTSKHVHALPASACAPWAWPTWAWPTESHLRRLKCLMCRCYRSAPMRQCCMGRPLIHFLPHYVHR